MHDTVARIWDHNPQNPNRGKPRYMEAVGLKDPSGSGLGVLG